MNWVIAGDYDGVFGLQRRRRVFRDGAGQWLCGVAGSIVPEFRGQEDLLFLLSGS